MKANGFFLAFGFLLLMSACSTPQGVEGQRSPAAQGLLRNYEAQVVKTSIALRNYAAARPAPGQNAPRALLTNLNKIQPGRFEIYLFPKISPQTARNNLTEDTVLGRPKVMEVAIPTVGSCQYLIGGQGGFKKYNPQQYFLPDVISARSQCAIIEITSKSLLNLPPPLRKPGDVLRKRLFIDDAYRVHGLETDLFVNGRDIETVGQRLDPRQPFNGSGLHGFPLEFPPLLGAIEWPGVTLTKISLRDRFSKSSGPMAQLSFDEKNLTIDQIAQAQIKKINHSFDLPACQAISFQYRSSFSHLVTVDWCEYSPWPQIVNTPNFLAVTQNLKGF